MPPPQPLRRAAAGTTGRPRTLPPERLVAVRDDDDLGYEPRQAVDDAPGHAVRLEALVREWLLDLQVLGRSRTTIDWYGQKMRWYLQHGEARTLGEPTPFELKRYLAELQSRGLSDNTVHGAFETLRALSNWASREGYPVDPALLRVRAPKVAQKEMETYSAEQQQAVLRAAPAGWARMAVAILLGTGMRAGEFCALSLEDLEDDGEATFLISRPTLQAALRGKRVRPRTAFKLARALARFPVLEEIAQLLEAG